MTVITTKDGGTLNYFDRIRLPSKVLLQQMHWKKNNFSDFYPFFFSLFYLEKMRRKSKKNDWNAHSTKTINLKIGDFLLFLIIIL